MKKCTIGNAVFITRKRHLHLSTQSRSERSLQFFSSSSSISFYISAFQCSESFGAFVAIVLQVLQSDSISLPSIAENRPDHSSLIRHICTFWSPWKKRYDVCYARRDSLMALNKNLNLSSNQRPPRRSATIVLQDNSAMMCEADDCMAKRLGPDALVKKIQDVWWAPDNLSRPRQSLRLPTVFWLWFHSSHLVSECCESWSSSMIYFQKRLKCPRPVISRVCRDAASRVFDGCVAGMHRCMTSMRRIHLSGPRGHFRCTIRSWIEHWESGDRNEKPYDQVCLPNALQCLALPVVPFDTRSDWINTMCVYSSDLLVPYANFRNCASQTSLHADGWYGLLFWHILERRHTGSILCPTGSCVQECAWWLQSAGTLPVEHQCRPVTDLTLSRVTTRLKKDRISKSNACPFSILNQDLACYCKNIFSSVERIATIFGETFWPQRGLAWHTFDSLQKLEWWRNQDEIIVLTSTDCQQLLLDFTVL